MCFSYLYSGKNFVMKNIFILLFIILNISIVTAQNNYKWGVDLDYFFNNSEYDKSTYAESGTMQGIWLKPRGRISWDKENSIDAGVNLLAIPGNKKTLEKINLTMFYQFQKKSILFKVGSFPRQETLGNYDTFFFRDSVNYYTPNMRGVFWQVGRKNNFINAWIDWTGNASHKVREDFFVGFSGKASTDIFFAEFQSYMFHRALTNPPIEGEGVSENIQIQAMAGINYTSPKGFNVLAAGGVLAGYERDRRYDNTLYKPIGYVAKLNLEYWGIGTKNSFYIGDPRMILYNDFGGSLYHGTPFLQGKSYLKNELYIKLIENRTVDVIFFSNMHFSQKEVLFQQLLTVTARVGNLFPRSKKKTNYPWKDLFNY